MVAIWNIGTATRNNWILETPAGIIAIDTGLPGQSDGFLVRFGKHRRTEDLAYVFITHAHIDHAGFAEELLAKTTAKLILGEQSLVALKSGRYDAEYIYKNWLGKLLDRRTNGKSGSYPPVSDMAELRIATDTFFEKIGVSAQVIGLPGHTTDSIGLFLPENNVVFCGDAAMNLPLFNANRHTVMIENIRDYYESWDKIIKINPDIIYPGHGKAFEVSDLISYRNWLSQI